MNNVQGEILKFTRTKEYVLEKCIGQGGTGETVLIKDSITDTFFVCKKYSPYDISKKNEYFKRFIDEIKIMFLLSHKNIVRIYNYFLYPENTTGYIVMEYVDGTTINEYLQWANNEIFENVFLQLMEGFEYLEKNDILHRDIRNNNILVTKDGIVKIIDFGFGKKIEKFKKNDASIILNWPVSEFPDEINDYQYTHQTEIYFVGKLFNKLIDENHIEDFRYQYIINKMIITNPTKRIKSFSEVIQNISSDTIDKLDFTIEEKEIYQALADSLISHISYYNKELELVVEPRKIISSLEVVIKESLLEDILQNNNRLISCFITNGYNYSTKKDIEMNDIRAFYKLLIKLPYDKQKIVLDNLHARLKAINVINTDELPF